MGLKDLREIRTTPKGVLTLVAAEAADVLKNDSHPENIELGMRLSDAIEAVWLEDIRTHVSDDV